MIESFSSLALLQSNRLVKQTLTDRGHKRNYLGNGQSYEGSTIITIEVKGRSPGLVVTGDDSCLRGRGFKSLRHILDGHDIYSLIICCKNCIHVWVGSVVKCLGL